MRLFILAMLTAAMLLTPQAAMAGFDTKVCEQILRSTANNIDCQLNFSTNAQERDELMKKTYGIIHDITCSTHLNLLKNQVANALFRASDVQVAAHKISCEIQTNGDKFQIGLTVAPWIQFAGDGAEEVRLNVSDVTGIPPFIGKWIIKYGNGSKLQEKAKAALNQFLSNLF
jgi:hypothetical protein